MTGTYCQAQTYIHKKRELYVFYIWSFEVLDYLYTSNIYTENSRWYVSVYKPCLKCKWFFESVQFSKDQVLAYNAILCMWRNASRLSSHFTSQIWRSRFNVPERTNILFLLPLQLSAAKLRLFYDIRKFLHLFLQNELFFVLLNIHIHTKSGSPLHWITELH